MDIPIYLFVMFKVKEQIREGQTGYKNWKKERMFL